MQAVLAGGDNYLSTNEKDILPVKNAKIAEKYLIDVPTEENISSFTIKRCKKLSQPICPISCYMSKVSLPDYETFGYGITVNNRNGSVSSQCEYLSCTAFENGVRVSSTNQQFQYWLPLFINNKHWLLSKDLFYKTMKDIYSATGKPMINNISIEEMSLYVLSSVMNNNVVEVMNAKNNLSANDKFIDGYFAFYRLLLQVKKEYPNISTIADKKIETFLQSSNNRSKNTVPNLGDWLILLLVSNKYKWTNVSSTFIEECDARNVFWYVQGNYNNPAKCPELSNTTVTTGRCTKVFDATQTSRNLVCFQTKFLSIAEQYNIAHLDSQNGLTDDNTKKLLKDVHTKISEIKNWNGYFTWNNMKEISEGDRCSQLINAVKSSQERGYHGNQQNNSHGNNRGGFSGRGRGRGRGGYY
jgi:hypothetical protein